MFTISSTHSPRANCPATRHPLITVSIVDGNAAFRTLLAQNLARFPGVVIFDKCDSATAAEKAVAERPPRVLFVGNNLPDSPSWVFMESLRTRRVGAQVIAVSDSEAVSDIQAAFRARAMGYLLRTTPLPLVHQALYDVTGGGAPLTPSVARALVMSFSAPPPETGLLAELTSRESEVLDMLSRGLRYRQIATTMRLSPDTVHSHAKNVYRKLKVKSKTEAALLWLRSLGEAGGPPKLLNVSAAAEAVA